MESEGRLRCRKDFVVLGCVNKQLIGCVVSAVP